MCLKLGGRGSNPDKYKLGSYFIGMFEQGEQKQAMIKIICIKKKIKSEVKHNLKNY